MEERYRADVVPAGLQADITGLAIVCTWHWTARIKRLMLELLRTWLPSHA